MNRFPQPWIPDGCGRGCWNAYLEFIANHAEHSHGLEDDQLDAVLAEAEALADLAPSGSSREELRQRIIDGLAVGFLLEGLPERDLSVAELGESRSREGVTRRSLLFWDPVVGSFEGLLLLPPGEGPHPGVIGLHGHRDHPEIFAEEFLGDRLARNGIAVLMPRFRVHDCSVRENRMARTLLSNGFTLMGLRVYEVLLMHKYLEHLDTVDAQRVGLLSHSGGSSAANLVVRISDRFRAHVADYQVDYRNDCGPLKVHCETVPALAPLAGEINDFGTLAVPYRKVPYKFSDPELQEEIVAFFRQHLATTAQLRSKAVSTASARKL